MLYFMALGMVAAAIYLISSSIAQMRRRPRLRYISETSTRKQFNISSIKVLKPLMAIMRPISKLPYFQKLKMQAEILKMNLDLNALVFIKIVAGAILGFLVYSFLASPVYALIAGVVGFMAPDFLFLSKVRAKKEEIVRVFPETVDLIDLCIGAGLDFPFSIKWVIDKSEHNAFVEQLAIVLSEIQVGRNRIDALKDMAHRLQLVDISSFVRAVVQSERMGTSVEEGFRHLSEDTRVLRFQEGERYAIKAAMKILFPLLFCILPVIMIVVAGPIIIKFTQGDLLPSGGAF